MDTIALPSSCSRRASHCALGGTCQCPAHLQPYAPPIHEGAKAMVRQDGSRTPSGQGGGEEGKV